jgi:hypothetical protein
MIRSAFESGFPRDPLFFVTDGDGCLLEDAWWTELEIA